MEDDEPTRALIASNLDAHGYGVARRARPRDALRAWDAQRPDLVVLDLGLPDADGTSVIRRLRRDGTTPILILSARGEERDKVAALELGADDYVTKPFGMAGAPGAGRRAASASGRARRRTSRDRSATGR